MIREFSFKKLIFVLTYKKVYLWSGEYISCRLNSNSSSLPLNLLLKEGDLHNRHTSPPRRNGREMAELILLSLEDLYGFRRTGTGGGMSLGVV